jgi:uncharacterized protein (DUF1499 family)
MNVWWLCLLPLSVVLTACSSNGPPVYGGSDRKLSPCPESPNCVSSQSADEKHFVEPFAYKGSLEQTRDAIIAVIKSMKRSTIVINKEDYVRAEFRSTLFRFVDDVECYFNDAEKRVHVRSASRVGYSDLGVNRRRIEKMRTKYETLDYSKE